MSALQEFIQILSGRFNNAAQYEAKKGEHFPYAEHVNTPCNDKITGLPADFAGVFLVEESYYTLNGQTHGSPHLFLFTQEGDAVKLTSYELPAGCDKDSFTYDKMAPVAYSDLKPSARFTPAVYTCREGVWQGGSTSMFSPVLKFTLWERFSPDLLEVSERMEVNGKRTFGFDEPILYTRV